MSDSVIEIREIVKRLLNDSGNSNKDIKRLMETVTGVKLRGDFKQNVAHALLLIRAFNVATGSIRSVEYLAQCKGFHVVVEDDVVRLLQMDIEVVEEALDEDGSVMSPDKKAQLIYASYDLMREDATPAGTPRP